MKYRSKLYLSFIGIALASSSFAIAVIYSEFYNFSIQDFKNKTITTVATASSFIDPEQHNLLHTKQDISSDAYKSIRTQLKKVQEANLRSGFPITYIYTITLNPNDPSKLIYIVDADENENTYYPLGFPYEDLDEQEIIKHLQKTYVNENFVYDLLGEWVSAYFPIRDKNGNYVASLGIDVNANEVYTELKTVKKDALYSLLASILLATIAATILSRMVSTPLALLCNSVKEIGEGNLETRADTHTNDEFNELAIAINDMTQGLQERERLKTGFAKYVSEQILEKVLGSKSPSNFEGERKKITVLFSDIRQFTHIAENLAAEDTVAILNEYFEKMIQIIFKNHGNLDKFLGDGIMVEFGAPNEDPEQEKNAVMTAIDMQNEMVHLQEKWESEGKPHIEIGVGIHTGFAIVGNIGSEIRTEYTAVGETVNVAASLEKATKAFKTSIVISETTYAAVKDLFHFKPLGLCPLDGKTDKLSVYAVSLSPPLHQEKSTPPPT